MKNIVKFLKDRRGVSPVIGVILMVAITVVLGAVVAAFAYGYVGQTTKAPQVVLSAMDNPTDNVSLLIKHSGGEKIAAYVANPLTYYWKASVTAGKDSPTDFADQTDTGNKAISTGTTLLVTGVSVGGHAPIAPGWYHVVAVYAPSDSILLDTNVLVH